jgi:hypothetical protein
MNTKILTGLGWSVLFILAIGLAGCNYPGRATETTPAGQYTQAAQTVQAQITAVIRSATLTPGMTPPTAAPTVLSTRTPVPTATLPLAPTPTENLKLLFSDDFSSETGWYTEQAETYGFEFIAGGYRIYADVANAKIWSIRDKTYTDIVLEVEAARMAGSTDGYYGVLCRQVDDDNYYALVIGSNGFYGIGKMASGEFSFLKEGQDTKGVILPEVSAFNKIRADCIGDTLRLYANGQQLIEVQDGELRDGVTGLIIGTRKQPGLEVLFDNFATYQPLP